MIFAGINYERKTSIQFVEDTWKAKDYAGAIKKMFKELRDDNDENDYVLYQDNAPIHTALLTKKVLEENDIQSV